ncbi:hypothetical protein SEA_OREGANO_62 [Gordonia phage Oregano]|nr:hypothetical protein SEA_OREGANO_62 [Gordonia phage Oregano]
MSDNDTYIAAVPVVDMFADPTYQRELDTNRARSYRAERDAALATLQQVREYIDTHEHPDDWGVPCVYTKGLRELLDGGAR